MALFYKATRKEILETRNKIVTEAGIPALERQGFVKSPFATSWYGKDDLHGFTYYLCRLTEDSLLQDLEIQIARDDNWIKVILNIFKLVPELRSLSQLEGMDGLSYKLPPNSITEMRLRSDDVKGPPIFSLRYSGGHKLKRYYTRRGLTMNTAALRKNIEGDLNDIDRFIERWHALHQPKSTNWEGSQIVVKE